MSDRWTNEQLQADRKATCAGRKSNVVRPSASRIGSTAALRNGLEVPVTQKASEARSE